MGQLAGFSAEALLDALGVVATVLADHSEAIDTLDMRAEDLGPGAEGGTDDGSPGGSGGAGSDMAATLDSACGHAAGARDLRSVVTRLHAGSLLGARGPAGQGLAAVLESLAEVTTNTDEVDGDRFALALELAAVKLLADRDAPDAGTLPAVVSAAANGALTALDQGLTLGDILISAADDGLAELENGPVANRVLAERGTVDAASAGFLLVLDALSAIVTDEPLPVAPLQAADNPDNESEGDDRPGGGAGSNAVGRDASGGGGSRGPVSTEFQQYVVRCQVKPLDGCGVEAAAWLESTWHELGRLVEFRVGSDRWHVHLRTTLPGTAVEALCSVGVPTELHIGLSGGDPMDSGVGPG